jgi:hypothetical protein
MIVERILTGDALPSEAIGRPDLYDALTIGATGQRMPLLGSSSKIAAGLSVDVLGAVLYMVPANGSGREACAFRSAGCTAACLAEGTGRMSMSGPQRARRRRHAAFFADRGRFLADLADDIRKHRARALKQGKIPAVRLNGTTDLPWHRMKVTVDGTTYPNLHAMFPDVSFYEYTKVPLSIATKGGIPTNLHFTFSVSEKDDADERAGEYLSAGYGAAVVIAAPKHAQPETFTIGNVSYPMVDGDAHDARFLDPSGSIVALAMKGNAKTDTTGFVRSI